MSYSVIHEPLGSRTYGWGWTCMFHLVGCRDGFAFLVVHTYGGCAQPCPANLACHRAAKIKSQRGRLQGGKEQIRWQCSAAPCWLFLFDRSELRLRGTHTWPEVAACNAIRNRRPQRNRRHLLGLSNGTGGCGRAVEEGTGWWRCYRPSLARNGDPDELFTFGRCIWSFELPRIERSLRHQVNIALGPEHFC